MAEETENKSRISIWWDIENCHVPKDVDPHYIVKNIAAALQHASLTGPIEIQVFGDTMILPHNTQRALSDTGITLNHVPRGNKDAADKAILVAMLLWALDNPPPANILLISGDGDFANALNRLGLKTYSILLAIPAQFVKPALTGAAKKLWFWTEMAKGQLAEPKISQGNGDASSKVPAGLSRAMDRSSSMNVSATHSSAVSNGYSSPQKKIADFKVASTSEHFRSLSLENHPSSFSSTGMLSDNRNRSRAVENVYHVPSDRKMSPGGASNSSASNRLNASQSLPHVSGSSSSGARSVDFGQYPYFLPQAGGKVESLDSATSSASSEDSRSSEFSSSPAGRMPRGPLKHIAPNNNRGANNEPSVKNIVSDKKVDHNVLPHKHNASEYRNANNNMPPSCRPTTSTPPSNATMSNPQKIPPSFQPTASTAPSNATTSNPQKIPPSITPIPPSNAMMNNSQKMPPSYRPTTSTPTSNAMMSNPQNIPPSCRPPTSTPPSNAMMSNPQKMSHGICLDKIYSAMKTLERDMLAPTASNLSDCIQYWDPLHERVDVKQTLNKAAELKQVTKTQLGGGLVMFFPPEHRVPWNCVDPGNMQCNHSGDVWRELQQFLLYSETKQAFLSSCSRYDAALILKNSCGMYIQSLVTGKILNLLQQAMQEKKWLRKNGPGWAPLVLNQKFLLDWSGDETQKGDLRPSTNLANPTPVNAWKPAVHSNSESMPDKDVALSTLRVLLSQILKESTGYNLSLLPKEFERATGIPLNYQKFGYANLQELMKEFTDVAYVEATNSGLLLLYPVKLNENVVGLQSNMADKENDEKALRQIQVVRELKSWLSHVMSTVKDGYDISKVQEDFLQASGKDLNREGLDFNKLQCILNQFRDVIHITRSSGGLWLAYPASHGVGIGIKSARGAVVSSS